MFPLCLSGTTFTWFTSLAPNSILTWAQLEHKFYEYFYSGDTKLRLSHLTAITQKHNEPIADYIRRFRDIRNQCFNLHISNKDLTDLAYLGLLSHLREKLESHVFFDVSLVLQKALDCKSRVKESRSATRSAKVVMVHASPPSRHHLAGGGTPHRSPAAPLTTVGS
jgi:hypothetical protein